jgi:hypothetical protein
MAEEKKQQNFEVLTDNYEQEMLAKKRAAKKALKEAEPPAKLRINSLMDILTILLVFLLKSYSTDAVAVTPSADLDIPKGNTMLTPEQTVAVTVSKSAILVDNQMVLAVKDGKVEASQKRGGEDGYFIVPLNKALTDAVEKQRRIAAVNPSAGKSLGICTVIMDSETPFRMLTEVMYTAGQAEFSKFKFLVVSTDGQEG